MITDAMVAAAIKRRYELAGHSLTDPGVQIEWIDRLKQITFE